MIFLGFRIIVINIISISKRVGFFFGFPLLVLFCFALAFCTVRYQGSRGFLGLGPYAIVVCCFLSFLYYIISSVLALLERGQQHLGKELG